MEWQSNLKAVFKRTIQSNNNTVEKGKSYEHKAEAFLIGQGLKFLSRNYTCKQGEIDLIMQESETIVFVEVRFRSSELFGGAIASVTKNKQHKVRLSAEHYLLNKKLYEKYPVRFDVVALSKTNQEWIKGAF